MLSIDSAFDAWETREAPGWRIGLPWRSTDATWTIVAACRLPKPADTEDRNDSEENSSAPDPHPSKVVELGWSFDGLLIRFAAFCLLAQYERIFGALRDQMASSGTEQTALEMLASAHTTLTTLSFDASLVATEFKQWASDEFLWRHESIEPKTATPWKQEREPDYPPLLKVFADNINDRAAWILDLEPRIRDQLVSRTSILAVSADLRLQRVVLTVSLIALVVACLSLVLQ